jgi:uncharacterized membrane protein YqaE (UPF0057 family)
MNKIVLVILSLFIPPLAVYLKTKSAKDTIINPPETLANFASR